MLPRPCHALVLLNPQSGSGRALDDYQAVVQPMLAEADITTTVFVTGESMSSSSSSSSSFSFPWDPTWALPRGVRFLPAPLTLHQHSSGSHRMLCLRSDCLASCIPGWGHHLGLESQSGEWQQEGQRDGG